MTPIPLFWWSERKFIFKDKENYGDLLSEYLVEKISGCPVKWVHPKKQPWYRWDKTNFLAIGSILHHATRKSIVWGSGIIDREQALVKADFRAVRGPRTREFLQAKGFACPEVYGDPALLLPDFYAPEIEKKYRLGIIPHYHDFKQVEETYAGDDTILVIDLMTLEVEAVTRQFLQCESTLSSSLHGLIVSHAYNIPSVWVEFSKKLFGDGIKFMDYLESVALPNYTPPFLENKLSLEDLQDLVYSHPNQPTQEILQHLKKGLIASCPFVKE